MSPVAHIIHSGTGTESEIVRTIRSFKRDLMHQDGVAMHDMARAYMGAHDALVADIDDLVAQIVARQEAGLEVSRNMFYRLDRYEHLMNKLETEMLHYNRWAARYITERQMQAAKQAVENAAAVLRKYGGGFGKMPEIPVGAAEAMAGLAGDESPLATLLQKSGSATRQAVMNALQNGISLGKGPKVIAADMRRAVQLPYERSLTISRTETLRAYRQSSLQMYREMGITQYMRICALDERTCLGCALEDGAVYSTEREFEEHVCGRCDLVPLIPGKDYPYAENWRDWFAQQDERTQLSILGPSRFYAIKNDEVTLRELGKYVPDRVWGGAFVPKTLKELGIKRWVAPRPVKVRPIKPVRLRVKMKPYKRMLPAKPTPISKMTHEQAKDLMGPGHSLDDLLAGRVPAVLEDAGTTAAKARELGLYVSTGPVKVIARNAADAKPLVTYFERGGRYGTPQMSTLMGFTRHEVAIYTRFLETHPEAKFRELAHAPKVNLKPAAKPKPVVTKPKVEKPKRVVTTKGKRPATTTKLPKATAEVQRLIDEVKLAPQELAAMARMTEAQLAHEVALRRAVYGLPGVSGYDLRIHELHAYLQKLEAAKFVAARKAASVGRLPRPSAEVKRIMTEARVSERDLDDLATMTPLEAKQFLYLRGLGIPGDFSTSDHIVLLDYARARAEAKTRIAVQRETAKLGLPKPSDAVQKLIDEWGARADPNLALLATVEDRQAVLNFMKNQWGWSPDPNLYTVAGGQKSTKDLLALWEHARERDAALAKLAGEGKLGDVLKQGAVPKFVAAKNEADSLHAVGKLTDGGTFRKSGKGIGGMRVGKVRNAAWTLEHQNVLRGDLTDLFERFPNLPRYNCRNFVSSEVGRAHASWGSHSMTWQHENYAKSSREWNAEWRATHDGRPRNSYTPGNERSGTIRHEFCHTIQANQAASKAFRLAEEQSQDWLKATGYMARQKAIMPQQLSHWRGWYFENVSSYEGDAGNQWFERMAECFVRYTEPPPNGYVRGTYPPPMERYFDRLARGDFSRGEAP